MTNSDLLHYGVRGMKWGVRKNRRTAVKQGLNKTKNAVQKAIRDVDKAAVLRNVVGAGLGAAATMGASAVIGNPVIAGMGVAAVQTTVQNYGELTAIQASEKAVAMLSAVRLVHGG